MPVYLSPDNIGTMEVLPHPRAAYQLKMVCVKVPVRLHLKLEGIREFSTNICRSKETSVAFILVRIGSRIESVGTIALACSS